jgi:drug/metabolite transporter (DMT)-like permease
MRKGPLLALLAALLFGLSTPFAKLLLGTMDGHLLAGLLYLGSGIGLGAGVLWRKARPGASVPLAALERSDWLWLIGAIAFGGALAPVLLMAGLARSGATTASLLLNLEGVFTALLAWFVFRENINRRIASGFALIMAGSGFVSWSSQADLRAGLPALLIAAACLCWGIDNNLTRKISHTDSVFIAAVKGLVAGTVNVMLASLSGNAWPGVGPTAAAMALGLVSYGISLVCFIIALRHVGAARTGAYFATAPFIGAVVAGILLHESVAWWVWVGGALMLAGVWLHLTEVPPAQLMADKPR